MSDGLEEVLAAHVDVGGGFNDDADYVKYLCLCGEGSNDHEWHRTHVADAIRAHLATP